MAEGRSEQPGDHFLSLVVPVYNEAENIIPLLTALQEKVESDHELLLVYDSDDDSTLPPARTAARSYRALRLVQNKYGRGALNALKTGIEEAQGDVILVTMADLSDDISQVDFMAGLIRDGATVVSASRYMRGGRQIGGPRIKSAMSRLAGLSLHWLTFINTHDPTNNFKAYRGTFVRSVEVESAAGFELGLELTTKAHLAGHSIVEIPTVWRDRSAGESNFKLLSWLPSYMRWYWACVIGTWSGQRRRSQRNLA